LSEEIFDIVAEIFFTKSLNSGDVPLDISRSIN